MRICTSCCATRRCRHQSVENALSYFLSDVTVNMLGRRLFRICASSDKAMPGPKWSPCLTPSLVFCKRGLLLEGKRPTIRGKRDLSDVHVSASQVAHPVTSDDDDLESGLSLSPTHRETSLTRVFHSWTRSSARTNSATLAALPRRPLP